MGTCWLCHPSHIQGIWCWEAGWMFMGLYTGRSTLSKWNTSRGTDHGGGWVGRGTQCTIHWTSIAAKGYRQLLAMSSKSHSGNLTLRSRLNVYGTMYRYVKIIKVKYFPRNWRWGWEWVHSVVLSIEHQLLHQDMGTCWLCHPSHIQGIWCWEAGWMFMGLCTGRSTLSKWNTSRETDHGWGGEVGMGTQCSSIHCTSIATQGYGHLLAMSSKSHSIYIMQYWSKSCCQKPCWIPQHWLMGVGKDYDKRENLCFLLNNVMLHFRFKGQAWGRL